MQQRFLFRKYLRRFNYKLKILSFLGFVLFFVYFFSSTFSVKKIEIVGKKKREILGLETLYSKNIFFLNEKEYSSKLVSYNPFLKEVKIEKVYPDKLKLYISWRKAFAILKVKQGFFILDKEARLLERIRTLNEDLPIINFYQNFDFEEFSPGEYLDFNELKYTLRILDLLTSYKIKIKKVDIFRGDMILFKLEENDFGIEELIITSEKELEKEEYELKELLRYLKVSGRKAKKIDLRFKRPILK